jgi:glutamyl-tRNA synthetase
MDMKKLADRLFPDVVDTLDTLEQKYPARPLPDGGEVTRFAPSPTGFLHTGSLFAAMVARNLAARTGGVFFLRLEDTDTKRSIDGSEISLIEQMQVFGVEPMEGFKGGHEFGPYGPYRQSDRAPIYRAVIKHMVANNMAYPCFATIEELETLRAQQQAEGVVPGYYGKYAKYRDLGEQEVNDMLDAGEPYVIRFRSTGDHTRYIKIKDLIRGELELSENDQDIVILKSDGLPTYHFAHVVDDHFMRTTTVTRGEEWLPSLPIHLQIFAAIGWKEPLYAHLPVISKTEDGKKRKLSKRNDPEASVSYFIEKGYPFAAVIEYLMTIANSNFESWRAENPGENREIFPFSFSKMSLDGAIFDLVKIESISRDMISKVPADKLAETVEAWAKSHDKTLYSIINRDKSYFASVLNVEREKVNPRKDFAKYADILPVAGFFYDDEFEISRALLPKQDYKCGDAAAAKALRSIDDELLSESDETSWLEAIKARATSSGFAANNKDYKASPGSYSGNFADFMEVIRVALTNSRQSPSLFEIMRVLGPSRVKTRLDRSAREIERSA